MYSGVLVCGMGNGKASGLVEAAEMAGHGWARLGTGCHRLCFSLFFSFFFSISSSSFPSVSSVLYLSFVLFHFCHFDILSLCTREKRRKKIIPGRDSHVGGGANF